jgi:hypothetical protein
MWYYTRFSRQEHWPHLPDLQALLSVAHFAAVSTWALAVFVPSHGEDKRHHRRIRISLRLPYLFVSGRLIRWLRWQPHVQPGLGAKTLISTMMFRFVTTAILLFIACSLAVLSKPVDPVSTDKPKLPFTTCIKTGKTGKTTGIAHIIEADRARVAHLKGEAAAHDVTESPKITDPWSSNKQVNRRRSMHSINAANAAVRETPKRNRSRLTCTQGLLHRQRNRQ